MTLHNWYRIFDDCIDLDDLRERWFAATQEHQLNPGYETLSYHDAILFFLAGSSLSASLKLGVLLTCVSGFDFDPRLALGALDELDGDNNVEWQAVLAEAAALLGPPVPLATCDPALANFALGRLTGLRDTLRWDRVSLAHSRAAFWDAYLELACRWAEADALELALRRGATIEGAIPQAIQVLAEGAHAHAVESARHAEGRTNADYLALLDRLRDAGLKLPELSSLVLPAAAAVDNSEMLDSLLERGADLAVAGAQALAAAASNYAHGSLEWLLDHGVNAQGALNGALIGAVTALDETMVEILLDAGADIHADDELALCTACGARPVELYNGESGFVRQRADMVVLLVRRGADPAVHAFASCLRRAERGKDVLSKILGQPDLKASHQRLLQAAGAVAFDAGASR